MSATAPPSRPSSNPRPWYRIGVLLDELDGDFRLPLINGLCLEAERLGVALVLFPGHMPGSLELFQQQFGMSFRMVDPREFDGLLVFGTLLQGHLDETGIRRFIAGLPEMPTVVVGVEGTGHPTVMIDNRAGFTDLLRHLITVHGHTRIAMIEGPTGNRDAQERLAIFLEVLGDCGLDTSAGLRATGNFSTGSGRDAMTELLSRGVPFTALVCANDEMAHGALSVAVERGLRVPEDLALSGFDDLLATKGVGPPLTSVNQAVDAQGELALRLLIAQLRGEPVPTTSNLATRLVLRRSCGCRVVSTPDTLVERTLREQAGALVARMAPPEALVNGLTDDVLALRAALIDEPGGSSFEQALTRMAFKWLGQRSDISPLQDLLVGMHRRWSGELDPQRLADVSEQLQLGQILLSNAMELFHNRDLVASNRNTLDLRQELKTRMTAVDMDALLAILSDSLLRLGVRTCMLALYVRPTTLGQVKEAGLPPNAHLVLALDDGVLREDLLGDAFPTRQLLPAELLTGAAPRQRVVFPMFYLEEHYGYMVLDRQREGRFIYEDLHHEITTALHSCLVVKALATARDALHLDLDQARRDNVALAQVAMRDELTGLFNRRGFFELASSMVITARLMGQPLTLIFADLDGLKQINDQHGHEEGDFAIRESAALLHRTFRQDDIVSRIGGDEFVVLSRAGILENLPDIERRLDTRFDEFNAASGKPYRLGCSLGGTVIAADSVEPLDSVISQADRLLYAAKRRRRAIALKADLVPAPRIP